MTFNIKIAIAIVAIIIVAVIIMDKYEVAPMALLDGKSPFTSPEEKMKLRMEELIDSIHAAQGIKV